ncbi:MAG TPA: amidohydrolase family protein [Candidatus Dormibacteraeota bacterium]|nr:amidohydrolase family protein [Candidatus Dormibacteraeota bacterium]
MPVIDGHAHVFRPHSEQYPRPVDELAPAGREAPVEEFLRAMEKAGVERAVLVPLGPEDDYLVECLRRHPGRFQGIGVFDLAHPDPAALETRIERTGIRGLRMHGLGTGAADDVRRLAVFPTLEMMAKRGMVLWWYASPDQLKPLRSVLEALPELRVALNHMGFCPERIDVDEHGRPRISSPLPPPTLPAVLELARFPNVHVMLSGAYAFSRLPYPYRDLAPVARALYDAYGAQRMFWASDYPWIATDPGYEAMVELPDHLLPGLRAEERQAIMGGTIARLLG